MSTVNENKLISFGNLATYDNEIKTYIHQNAGEGGGSSVGFKSHIGPTLDWTTYNADAYDSTDPKVIAVKSAYYFKVCSYDTACECLASDMTFRIGVNTGTVTEFTRITINAQYPYKKSTNTYKTMRMMVVPSRMFFENGAASQATIKTFRLFEKAVEDKREIWLYVETPDSNHQVSEIYLNGVVSGTQFENIGLEQRTWGTWSDMKPASPLDFVGLDMVNFFNKTFIGNIDSHATAEGASVFGGVDGKCRASGKNSIAGGTSSTASDDSAISLGNGCKASGKYAVALGRQTDATAQSAIAIGQKSVATAWGAFAGGAEETLSAGTASFAFGKGVKDHPVEASGEASLAIGETYTDGSTYYPVKATGKAAVALGLGASSSGEAALAVGYRTAASNLQAVALGSVTEASGKYAVALGRNTKATAQSATAIGQSSTASGWGSLAGGTEECVASKKGAVALGGHAKAEGDFAVALGDHVTAKQNNQIVLGKYNTENSTSIVIVGNGSSSTPKNVFTIAASGTPTADTDGVTVKYFNDNMPSGGIDEAGVRTIVEELLLEGSW